MKFLTKLTAVTVMGIVMFWGNGVLGQSFNFNASKYNRSFISKTNIVVGNSDGWTYIHKSKKVSGPSKIKDTTVTLTLSNAKNDTQVKGKFKKKKEKNKWVPSQNVTVFKHNIDDFKGSKYIYKTRKRKKIVKRTIVKVSIVALKTNLGKPVVTVNYKPKLSKPANFRLNFNITKRKYRFTSGAQGKRTAEVTSLFFGDTQTGEVAFEG